MLFIPIRKVDEERREVYGTLCAETPDKAGEILDYASAVPAFKLWSDQFKQATNGKSLGNVRAMHGSVAAGKLTSIEYDDAGKAIHGCAKIVDDAEWEKCKSGVYTGFSIGGGYGRRWPDPDDSAVMRYTPTLTEVSLVDNPCVPTATFEAVKADGTTEMRKFNTATYNPKTAEEAEDTMADKKNEVKKGDAKFAQVWSAPDGTTHESLNKANSYWKAKQLEESASVKAATDALGSLKDAVAKASGSAESLDGKGVAAGAKNSDNAHPGTGGEEPPSTPEDDTDLDGEDEKDGATNSSNAGPGHEGGKGDGDTKEYTDLEGMGSEGAKESSNAKVQKKAYSDDERKEMADKGHAMPDGSFPIADKADLKNAVLAHGRAKDKAAVKDHIKARAKDLGAEDQLPDKWKGAAKASRSHDLAKGMCEVAEVAHMLECIDRLHMRVEAEQLMEGDTQSDQPEKVKAWCAQGVALLHAMVEEETSEMFDGPEENDILDAALDEHDEMLAVAKAEPIQALARFIKGEFLGTGKLTKATDAGLVRTASKLFKAGARHSKKDMAKIQEVHDGLHEMRKTMVDLGADQSHMLDDLGADQGNHAHGGVSKAAAQQLRKSALLLENSQLQNEVLEKTLHGVTQQVTELTKMVGEIAKRPQPAKGVSKVYTIGKGDDTGGAAGAQLSDEQLNKSVEAKLASMTDNEISLALVKAARMKPEFKK